MNVLLNRLSVKAKLMFLLAAFVLGLAAIGILSRTTVSRVSVNGPLYTEIVAGKDLVADILPPPLYIIEAYLNAHELPEARDKESQHRLIATLSRLEKEYQARHEYWETNLPEGELKRTLLVDAHDPAEQFFTAVTQELIPLAQQGRFETAQSLIKGKVTSLYTEHRDQINRVVQLTNQRNSQIETSAREEIQSSQRIYLITELAICLGVALLGWVIAMGIARPLKAALGMTKRMNEEFQAYDKVLSAIAENDLTLKVPKHQIEALRIDGKDEVAQLASAIDDTNQVKARMGQSLATMVENLGQVVRKIRMSSESLASASTEIAASAEEAAAGSREQMMQASQVSTAVEEMTANIQESARNTRTVSDVSQTAAQNAGSGTEQVAAAIQGMRRIAEVVSASGKTIEKLSSSSDAIGQIINVIDEIADQTNLLALNAAIEAARAGEQGRGFAVVADEVRKLAERTSKATGEISSMIKSIQLDTNHAVSSMDKGLTEIRSGQAIIDQAGTSLTQIQDLSQRVMDMIVQIARNADQQSLAAEEISRSIMNISHITRESATGAQQSAQAATELSSQAEEMKSLVKRFQV